MKILPIGKPDITAYPHHAHLYSILNGIDTEEKYKLPWLCNNYIQLEYESGNLDFSIGFDILPLLENCPWLIKDSISHEMVNSKWNSIVDFIVDAINLDYYIYMEVDEFFIKEYDNYNINHLSHTILIYGYDDKSNEFYVADFFKNRKYYFAKVSYGEIKRGYENIPTTFLFGVFLLRKKSEYYFTYEYSRMALIKNLEELLYSKNTKERNMIINYSRVMPHVEDSVFGLKALDVICEEWSRDQYLSLENLFVIKEHIIVLEKIILCLSGLGLAKDCGNILLLLHHIRKKSEICIKLYIKYQITKRYEIILSILKNLYEIRNKEETLIPCIIANLQEKERYSAFENLYFNAVQMGLRIFNCTYINDTFITNKSSSYMQATFLGNGIIYAAEIGEKYGECNIYLDGKKYGNVMLKTDGPNIISDILIINKLPYTFHTIRIQSVDQNPISLIYLKNIREEEMIRNTQDTFLCYIDCDKKTGGDWIGKYGKEGYVIPGFDWNYPIFGDVAILKINEYLNSEVLLSKMLLRAPMTSERVNKCYYCEKEETVNVIITGDKKRKVTFYLLDWTQGKDIQCCITVQKLITGEILDIKIVDKMENGVYITYELLGACQFVIKYYDSLQKREYGDFYGLFFD